jgi:hypothetical protein
MPNNVLLNETVLKVLPRVPEKSDSKVQRNTVQGRRLLCRLFCSEQCFNSWIYYQNLTAALRKIESAGNILSQEIYEVLLDYVPYIYIIFFIDNKIIDVLLLSAEFPTKKHVVKEPKHQSTALRLLFFFGTFRKNLCDLNFGKTPTHTRNNKIQT